MPRRMRCASIGLGVHAMRCWAEYARYGQHAVRNVPDAGLSWWRLAFPPPGRRIGTITSSAGRSSATTGPHASRAV